MLIDEYLEELKRLKPVLRRERGRQVRSQELRHRLLAIAETWVNDVHPSLAVENDENGNLAAADRLAGKLAEATYRDTTANKYLELVEALRSSVVKARVEVAFGPSRDPAPLHSEGGTEVESALEAFNPAIADSYRQVLLDLKDEHRTSSRGTANELREVLREVLEVLAPDERVVGEEWYEAKDDQGRIKPRPTYSDRAKYAIRMKGKNKSAQRLVATSVERADELLGSIVRSTYDRGSAATHASVERTEIVTQLRYVNAILLELI